MVVDPSTMNYQVQSVAKRKSENFMVASLLLPRKIRQKVIALYDVARHMDDIADEGELGRAQRMEQLTHIKQVLENGDQDAMPAWCVPFYQMAMRGEVDIRHGLALLHAFMQDVETSRYKSYAELWDYCMYSAAPVGRAMIELHEEWHADIEASDALCNALQMLNHIQDIKSDYLERSRVYIPREWYDNDAALAENSMEPALRQAVDKLLDEVDRLLKQGEDLFPTLQSWRFRKEIEIIHLFAMTLSKRLRSGDVLSSKVKLKKSEKLRLIFKGLMQKKARGNDKDGAAMSLAMKSKSSFLMPLLRMSGERRRAMLVFYGFCRAIDDAVDDAPDIETGKAQVAFWQQEVGRVYDQTVPSGNKAQAYAQHPVTRALAPVVKRYGIERYILDEMIHGQAMDLCHVSGEMSEEMLDLYCYRVASCVGLGSICIFGYTHPQTEQFAIHMGKHLQLINIMRDVREDAQRDRIYLPCEWLADEGLDGVRSQDIVEYSPQMAQSLQKIGARMADSAQEHYDEALQHLHKEDKAMMHPALMMQNVYAEYYRKLRTQQWKIGAQRIRISFGKKCCLAFKKI